MPLAISGALLFSFLGLTTLNIYSQVGLVTLVGLVSKNGILVVKIENKLQEKGAAKVQAVIEAAATQAAADPHDDRRHRYMGSLPYVFTKGPGTRGAQRQFVGWPAAHLAGRLPASLPSRHPDTRRRTPSPFRRHQGPV